MALVCKVELSQTKGLTLTVVNKDGNITQTAVFDGTTITFTCKGQDATSTITQTSDGITVKCNTYTVEAETITCKSTKNTTHQAQGTFTIDSTGKAAFSSDADMSLSAKSQMTLSGADFAASATNTAKLSGTQTTVDGSQKSTLSGAQVAVAAQAAAKMSGATVDVAAQTTMNVEGLTTTVKGQLTNVQGSLVKLG